MKPYVVMSNPKSAYFANAIYDQLKRTDRRCKLDINRKTFPGGEEYRRVDIEDRCEFFNKSAIYVGSTCTDQDIDEMYRVGCMLAKAGTRRRIFVIPFFGYSTMERAAKPGEVVTAKSVARRLSGIPNTGLGNLFLMMDLHVDTLVHFFEGDCVSHELYAEKQIVESIKSLGLKSDEMVIASADLGRSNWVQSYANIFGTDIAFIRKQRDESGTKVQHVVGEVEGKTVIIYDDMTRTAGTLINGGDAYMAKGAKEVIGVLSHLALVEEPITYKNRFGEEVIGSVLDRINNSQISKVITTDTHYMAMSKEVQASPKIQVVSVASNFAKVINQILD